MPCCHVADMCHRWASAPVSSESFGDAGAQVTYLVTAIVTLLPLVRYPGRTAFLLSLATSSLKLFSVYLIRKFSLATLLLWNTPSMIIGDRLRALREEKKLSQGDIEKRTGLLRCYISRVENGHTVPAIETLEKLARALECPLYQLFYDGEEPPQLPNLPKRKSSDDIAWGSAGKEARYLNKLRRLLSKADDEDRKLLLYMAQKMANR